MNNQKQLWEKLAHENARYYINSDKGRGITEEEFRESGRVDTVKYVVDDPLFKKDGILLEVGCGNGRMTEFLSDYYQTVIGVDISGEMIRQGQERLKRDNVNLIETEGSHIPLEDNTVDVVFSYIVFQHIKTIEMIEDNFREVYRVLKPNGIFKVRVRSAMDKHVSAWYSGAVYDETFALSIGFTLLKKEQVKNYATWLWLQK